MFYADARLELLSLAFKNNCIKTNTDRVILSELPCTVGTLVSGNINFMRIFVGFIWKEGVQFFLHFYNSAVYAQILLVVTLKQGRRSVLKLARVQDQSFSKGILEQHNPSSPYGRSA